MGCLASTPTPDATSGPLPSAVSPTIPVSSSSTPSPASSPTPAPSLTLIPTNTATPEPDLGSGQVSPSPTPLPGIAFEPESVTGANQLALWGRGAIIQRQLAANGQVWLVVSPLGIYLYDTQTMDQIAHIEDVRLHQISPDGQTVVVADSNQQISLYRLADGQKLVSLERPAFNETPDMLNEPEPSETAAPEATAIDEPGVDITGEGAPQAVEKQAENPGPGQVPGITALRFSEQGQGYLLAVGYDWPAIVVWDLQTGQIKARLLHAIMPTANRIEFSPDGMYLANNTYTNVLGLWSLADESLIWRTANGGRLTPASFLPDGRHLLTESATSERVYIWNLNSKSLEQTIQVTNLVDYLNFSQDGNSLFFLTRRPQSGQYLIEQRSLRDGKLETFAEFPGNYAIAPDQLRLAGMDENSQIQHFSLRDWQLTTDLQDGGDPARNLIFSASGSSLAAVGERSFTLWSFPDMQPLAEITYDGLPFNLHLDDLRGLQLLKSRSGDYPLAYGLDEGRLFTWDVLDGQIERLDLKDDLIGPPVLSPDGRYLAICSSGGLRLFDLNTSQRRLYDRCRSPGILLFSNDQTHLVRASGLQIDLLSLPGGGRIQYLAGNTLEITSLAFSPDGSLFASGTKPETGGAESVIWDLARPLFPMRLPVPSFGVESLAFSSDNQYLVTAGGDDKIRIWRVADGWLLRVRTLEGPATKVIFSPDYQLIVVGLSSGGIQLMSFPDGEPLARLEGHKGRVTGLAFSEDGTALYSTSSDGSVRLWGIPMPGAYK